MAEEARIEFQFRNRRFRDAEKGLEVLARQLDRNFKQLPPVLANSLQEYLDQVRRALIRRHSQRFNNPVNVPATGEDDLLRRRGGIRGVETRVRQGGGLEGVVGTMEVPFPLSVHEEGTTVRARRAQFLTIPLSAALDSRGVPLRPRARDWPNTFVKQSQRGNLLIFQRKGSQLVPLYLLKREVTLPPRLKALETLQAGQDFFVDTAIERMSRELLRGL